MSDHNSAVFNNSCLKVPRNPISNRPVPVYEQKHLHQIENEQKHLHQIENHTRKLSLDNGDLRIKSPSESDTNALKSFIEFYDSIPEYDDINHLSNKEFYRRLDNLKEKQRRYYERLQTEGKIENRRTGWVDDYKNINNGYKKNVTPTLRIKPFCTTPTLNKSPCVSKRNDDVESLMSSDKELGTKPSSRRSVRIESPADKVSVDQDYTPDLYQRPKSRASSGYKAKDVDFCNNSSIWNEFNIDDFKLDLEKESRLESRSAPNSPAKMKPTVGWKDTITIPQPFQMTVRDEENKIVEEVIQTTRKPKEEKPEMFKAHPVPIESQIPLFEKIMADQERRSYMVKNRRKAELLSKMQPFSFTRREEELQQLTKRLSKSSPSIFLDDPPPKVKKFRANPIPKNLFSNYIYKKMNEDEFYRALQKKIRAEEMLKASSLPPSMAHREKTRPKSEICPRSFRETESENDTDKTKTKRRNGIKYKSRNEEFEREFQDLTNEFMSSYPRYVRRSSKNGKKNRSGRRNLSAGSRCSETTATDLSLEVEPVNRSNLAALLRIQSARKRMEMEMCKRLEQARLKDETRWREKLMRKRPVWEALAYSHEEDLEMRLQMRREEERLRREQHKLYMQLMLGRVNQQPTLFERQSQFNHPKMGDDMVSRLLYADRNMRSSTGSLIDSSGKRSATEIKNGAIQVMLDEEFNNYRENRNGKEGGNQNWEEKEKCETSSESDDTKKN